MSENELFEHRIKTLENDVKILYGKVNTKLDNLLLSVGELKESISEIKRRPSAFWDKLLFALIGAVGTALGYALIGFVN